MWPVPGGSSPTPAYSERQPVSFSFSGFRGTPIVGGEVFGLEVVYGLTDIRRDNRS